MFSISFPVERSISVDASADKVFASLTDFKTWSTWSPWLCQEPACPVTIQGKKGSIGHSQEWDGEIIGSGKMAINALEKNKSVTHDLHFFKPFKSTCTAGFRILPDGKGCKVVWWMTGQLPFFLFFQKKTMIAWVGSDYDRGLSMLKQYLETGTVQSKLTFKNIKKGKEFFYLGKQRSCSLSELGPAMAEDFSELEKLVKDKSIAEPQGSFSIYHEFNLISGRCHYTSGFFYTSEQKAVDGIVAGHVPAHQAFQIDHRGSYRFLGNAWISAMSHVRAKHKQHKAIPNYEIYINNPKEVKEKDLKTQVCIPVK